MDDRTLLHLVLVISVLALASNALVLHQARSAGGPGERSASLGNGTAPSNAYPPGYFECSDLSNDGIMPKTDQALWKCLDKFEEFLEKTDCATRLESCKSYCSTLQRALVWSSSADRNVENPLYWKCIEWCELNMVSRFYPCS